MVLSIVRRRSGLGFDRARWGTFLSGRKLGVQILLAVADVAQLVGEAVWTEIRQVEQAGGGGGATSTDHYGSGIAGVGPHLEPTHPKCP